MDILPALERVDVKPSEPSPVAQFPHIELDNSEVTEAVDDSVSVCTDSAQSKGISSKLNLAY